MSNLSSLEKLKLEKFFEMSGGYVLDFSTGTLIFILLARELYHLLLFMSLDE
jgi:hypothetical protein